MNVWLFATFLCILQLSVWSASKELKNPPATSESVPGSDVKKLTLTPKAVERLDIRTAPVSRENGQKGKLSVPYSAVIYDTNGNTWVYTTIAPLTYMREPIKVVVIQGDKAILADGPKPDTQVVTMGVIELYGFETGIGK